MPVGVYDHKNTKTPLYSPELNRRRSEALKGRTTSPETRAKLSAALKGHGFSAEARQKISDGNRGKTMSPASRRLISVAGRGRRASPETRRRISEANKGPKSYFWRGGITPINRAIRNSVDYKLWREAVFARDDYTCQFCFVRGGKLNADHIKPFALFVQLRFDITNGRTLCVPCHLTTDTFGRNTKHYEPRT